ncbi:hypothetical protein Tco_1507186 [Tanacetum coccineum]
MNELPVRLNILRLTETIWSRPVNRVYVLDFEGLTPGMRQDLAVRLRMVYTEEGQQVMSDTEMGLDVADTLCFQLGGIRRRMTWRQFILALRLHTEQEMAEAGFGTYWDVSDRLIPDKGDLRDYWLEISSDWEFLGPVPSYVLIQDLVRRLTTNVPHLLEQYLFRHAEGRKSETRLLGGHFIGCLAMHFGLVSDEGLRGLHVVTRELLLIDLHKLRRLNICMRFCDTWDWEILAPAPAQGPPPPPPAPQPRTTSQRIERIERIEEEMRDLRHDVGGIRGVVESFTTEQSRVSTWLITYMTQLMMLAALLIRHLIAPSSVAHGCPTRGVSDPGQAMLAPPHPLMPMTSPTLNLFSL